MNKRNKIIIISVILFGSAPGSNNTSGISTPRTVNDEVAENTIANVPVGMQTMGLVVQSANVNGQDDDTQSIHSDNTDAGEPKNEYELDDEAADDYIRETGQPLNESDRQRLLDVFNRYRESEQRKSNDTKEYSDEMSRSPSIDIADYYSELDGDLEIPSDLLEKIKNGYLLEGREIVNPDGEEKDLELNFNMVRGFARYLRDLGVINAEKRIFGSLGIRDQDRDNAYGYRSWPKK